MFKVIPGEWIEGQPGIHETLFQNTQRSETKQEQKKEGESTCQYHLLAVTVHLELTALYLIGLTAAAHGAEEGLESDPLS